MKQLKIVFIAGADTGIRGSIQHEDDFRYFEQGVLMTRPIMSEFFSQEGKFRDREALIARTSSAPRRQIYFSGLFVYSLLTSKGYDVELINCFVPGMSSLGEKLGVDIDALCISTSFLTAEEVVLVVAEIKRINPEVPIFIGGRWVWNSYRVLMRQKSAPYAEDAVKQRYFFTMRHPPLGVSAYVVSPSGIPSLISVLEHIGEGKNWKDLPNLALPSPGEGFTFTQQRPDYLGVEDLSIDWTRIPRSLLSAVMPVSNSLGCPFRCRFCNFPSERHVRKPISQLRKELRDLVDTHRFLNSIWFIDDNLLLNKKQVDEFCRMMREEELPVTWRSFIRADIIDMDVAEMLKTSGCELLIIGMESVNDHVLDAMGKNVKASQYTRTAKYLAEVGLSAELSFIIGFPGEDEKSLAQLCDFLANYPAASVPVATFLYLFVFHLEPLSEAFGEEFRKKWDLKGQHLSWRHRTMDVETARKKLREVYLTANSDRLMLNYLDCHPANLTEHELAIRRQRERISKLIMLGDDVTEAKRELGRLVLSSGSQVRIKEQ